VGQTISQKIIAAKAGRASVSPGEIVHVKPDLAMLYDWPGFDGLMKTINIDADRVAINIDHYFSPPNEQIAKLHRNFRSTAKKYGVEKFYDVGRSGIGFHLFAEKGHIRPGMLVVHADPHVSTLSALGAYCVGTGADIISVFLTGDIWLKVPETLKVNVEGAFPKGVTSRDLFEKIVADIGPDGAQGMVVEFCGPAIEAMSVASRMVLCNSVQYISAETAIIEPDQKIQDYLKDRTEKSWDGVKSDPDASYVRILNYDLATLEPMVVTPPDVFYVEPIQAVAGKKINQAIIGTCASGRIEDLQMVAHVLEGRQIARDVRMIVTPITPDTHAEAIQKGYIDTILKAGALVGPSTCEPCYGAFGQLLPGEVCISTGTLNIPGRLGSTEADIYMANPATVAASAIEGSITDPRPYLSERG